MDIASSSIGKIGEYSMALIGKHLGYLIYYERNMENLKMDLQKLRERRDTVQHSIEAAELKQQVTSPEVKSWLTKVEQIISSLENDETNRKCLNGWCPNPKARYSSSRKAKNKAQVIGELLQEGRNYGGVYIDAPPPETGSSSSTADVKHFKSRISILNEVLIALRDDKINIIAICGMAGVGKTEMAKEIGRRAKVDHLFDKVVIAEVSQSQNLSVIQSEIAENLGLKLYQEMPVRANALNSIIKNVLVILDDIWEPLDLEKVGIPYGEKNKSCKILITSRSEETCSQMKTQIIFPIKPLSEVDAWNLFKRTAGDCIQNGSLFQIAKDVLKECGGLPAAIVIIGKALANKSNEEWTAVLQQLQRSGLENIPVYSKVYSSIKSSYDYLESKEARSCFLLCCLFPEDHNIPIEDLVRYGVGRNLFAKIATIKETRVEVHQMVRNLRRSNLLLDGDDKEHVKMHVVVRDVAISIASKDEHCFLVRCDYEVEEWPQNERDKHYATISSLVSTELERHLDGLECPKLQLLHMSLSLERPLTFPTNLSSGMKELKILSSHCISSLSLPSSIRDLQNLRVLKLENCSLKDVSAIESLLKLKILSFRGSYIRELPREIQNLSLLKLLDLSECSDLQRIPRGVFSSLSRLEELYMGQSFLCWESPEENVNKINASSADLFSSRHMMVLDICIPIRLLQKCLYSRNFRIYASERLDRLFELYIESSMHWKSRYLFENTLALECKASDIAKSPRILLMVQKAEILCLIEIQDLRNILYEFSIQSFPRLKFLEVSKCNMRYLIDVASDQTDQHDAFPLLESLVLRWTNKLVKICHNRGVLGNLRYLNLYGCTSLKNAFPLSIARDLIQLQRLIIEHCYAMEEIFFSEEEKFEKVRKMEFPKLYHVELKFLTSLIAFCKGSDPVSGFSNLAMLRCKNHPRIKD